MKKLTFGMKTTNITHTKLQERIQGTVALGLLNLEQ